MVITLKYGSKKDSLTKLLNKLTRTASRGIDAHKYSGLVELKGDPLKIQKALRNEWE